MFGDSGFYYIISFLLAVAPAAFLLRYYYRQDSQKPEPKGLITKIFILGLVSIIPIIIIELILDFLYQALFGWVELFYYFLKAFIVAALCEEFFKLMIVLKFAYKNVDFDESVDGIVYCIVASLGFACLENVLYVMGSGYETAILRAFTAIPIHAIAAGIMGYYVGMAKFVGHRDDEKMLIRKGFFFAVLYHGVYDFLLFSIPVWGFLPALLNIPLIIWGFISLKKKIKQAIASDIEAGRVNLVQPLAFVGNNFVGERNQNDTY
jgi:RsiW-degrading membrane proteinase PrsW (M82 family)